MKEYVIVDIDGTVADANHRLHYIQGKNKNWDIFYSEADKDMPIVEIIRLVRSLQKNYIIIFCTGRRESIRDITNKWLVKNVIPYTSYSLYMRKDGDLRPDSVAKMELLDNAGIKPKDIAFVLEDRNSMVKAWRDRGVK